MGYSEGSPERGSHGFMCPHCELSVIAYMNNSMTHHEALDKQEQAKSKCSSWKEIIKIWAEFNEIEAHNNRN